MPKLVIKTTFKIVGAKRNISRRVKNFRISRSKTKLHD